MATNFLSNGQLREVEEVSSRLLAIHNAEFSPAQGIYVVEPVISQTVQGAVRAIVIVVVLLFPPIPAVSR